MLEEETTGSALKKLEVEFSKLLKPLEKMVVHEPEGCLKHPYLIPAGYYHQMWDWDGFFMGCYFAEKGEAELLKHWVCNLLDHVDEEGYVSGCICPEGPRRIFGPFAAKPFLSQGALIAATALNDFSWLVDRFELLERVMAYREESQFDSGHGLYFWMNAMQSGADNNPALNYFTDDPRSFLACDINTFQLREMRALGELAQLLERGEAAEKWQNQAAELKQAMLQKLWCEEDQIFYNVDRETGDFYRRVSYSSFVPLFDGIIEQKEGRACIERYLINSKHMKATFGLRSLSLQDPDYNNRNIINPFSNWQGPVWPIANYIYSVALHRYGFHEENIWLASTLGTLLRDDIVSHGVMHENYHADSGEPLAPAHNFKTSEGEIQGFVSWNLCIQNLLQGAASEQWMLLDI